MEDSATDLHELVSSGTSPLTDEAIVERVRSGDTAAYELVMRRYNQRLYRVARSILRNPDDAEDAVQEAYVRAYFKLDSYIPGSMFGAWLTRIAINEALMIKRKRGKTEQHDDNVEHLVATSAGPAEMSANRQLAELIENAMDRLPSDFRTVFMLRAVQQLSVQETAACLDIPQATVKTRFHRARNLMQQMLNVDIESAGLHAFDFAGHRCDCIVKTVFERLRLAETE